MGSKRNRGQQQCSYCGNDVANAVSEHVLNKKLFSIADRGDLPQVPACRRCNTEKSKLEERLSYYWLLGQTDKRLDETSAKFAKNHPEVRHIMSTVEGFVTPDGIPTLAVGDTSTMKLIENWLGFIVRGLHRFHRDEIVPASHKSTFVAVTEMPDLLADTFLHLPIQRHGPFGYKLVAAAPPAIGSVWQFDLFGFRFAADGGRASITQFVFYKAARVLIA